MSCRSKVSTSLDATHDGVEGNAAVVEFDFGGSREEIEDDGAFFALQNLDAFGFDVLFAFALQRGMFLEFLGALIRHALRESIDGDRIIFGCGQGSGAGRAFIVGDFFGFLDGRCAFPTDGHGCGLFVCVRAGFRITATALSAAPAVASRVSASTALASATRESDTAAGESDATASATAAHPAAAHSSPAHPAPTHANSRAGLLDGCGFGFAGLRPRGFRENLFGVVLRPVLRQLIFPGLSAVGGPHGHGGTRNHEPTPHRNSSFCPRLRGAPRPC